MRRATHSGRSARRRRTVGAALAALLLLAGTARAQDSPRELKINANAKIARGNFVDAIPDLRQLIEYLGDSERTAVIADMETVFFNLGLCHFFVGQFEEAEKVFRVYIKKYRRRSPRVRLAWAYVGDCLRFRNKLDEAITTYRMALSKFRYSPTMVADVNASLARCLLAQDKWAEAADPLKWVYYRASDMVMINWAATLLTVAYFKDLDLDRVYPLVPFLLRPDSFASRSVVFNMAALEAGDLLFGDERYRDALWVYRMVYSHDLVLMRSQDYLERLKRRADRTREYLTDPRKLMRLQERIGELEEELKALETIENYDIELQFRIARGYMEMMRYWEARELFLYLHGVAGDNQAEEALFLAFRCSANIMPWDRAYEIGEMYMEEYPSGEFFDTITLAMGQMYARQQDWPTVIEHLTRTLQMSPSHQSAAECMFLIGYASFMEEKFDDAVTWLRRMNARFPGNDLVAPGVYWIGMALLFDGKYEDAGKEFDRVLQDFPECVYVEDAAFRTAVCAYGASDFERADERLVAFLAAYPASKLAAEALMMRGDVAGALGRIEAGIGFYQRAMEADPERLNIEYYNHCAFQCGQMLVDEEDYDRLRRHYQRYIEKAREGSNIPMAVYWIGICLWNTGETEGAMRYYRQAVVDYGKDPAQVGIDMILDEWIGRTKRTDPERTERAWQELRESLAAAEQEGNRTMVLRLKRALLYAPDLKHSEKHRMIGDILKQDSYAVASPAVLQAALGYAREQERQDLAVAIANEIVTRFTETDYALDARMIMARYALEQAAEAGARDARNGHYAEAVRHLGVVREVYASSAEAAEAMILLGQLYRDKQEYAEADEQYKSVLGVSGWRNYWPQALYGRGECAFFQRKYEAASAYYERIYLLYSHYLDWSAKAYLRRAECLKRMYQPGKAIEVIREMLASETLAEYPETAEARKLLAELGGDAS